MSDHRSFTHMKQRERTRSKARLRNLKPSPCNPSPSARFYLLQVPWSSPKVPPSGDHVQVQEAIRDIPHVSHYRLPKQKNEHSWGGSPCLHSTHQSRPVQDMFDVTKPIASETPKMPLMKILLFQNLLPQALTWKEVSSPPESAMWIGRKSQDF